MTSFSSSALFQKQNLRAVMPGAQAGFPAVSALPAARLDNGLFQMDRHAASRSAAQDSEFTHKPSRILLIREPDGSRGSADNHHLATDYIVNAVKNTLEANGCEVDVFRQSSDSSSTLGDESNPVLLGAMGPESLPRCLAAHGIMVISSVPCGVTKHSVHERNGMMFPAQEARSDSGMESVNLEGRVFSVIVHGDPAGAGETRKYLHHRLSSLGLVPADEEFNPDCYIGMLDGDSDGQGIPGDHSAFMQEVRNAAAVLMLSVADRRAGPN